MDLYELVVAKKMSGGGGGGGDVSVDALSVTENGTYSASSGHAYSPVTVSVPVGVFPSGTSSITANGIYDITNFASVDVNVSGGGGGGITVDDIALRAISGSIGGSATTIMASAFVNCSSITAASFPNVTLISSSAFAGCRNMSQIYAPNLTSVGTAPFSDCRSLKEIDFPQLKHGTNSMFSYASSLERAYLSGYVGTLNQSFFASCLNLSVVAIPLATELTTACFYSCRKLPSITLPNVSKIGSSAFANCSSLMTVNVLSTEVVSLVSYNAFTNTPMSNSTYTGSFGSIYVPTSLVDSYKAATNWSVYSARITAYTE